VETDPRFTNQKQWLGSDYMMQAFTTDPNNVLKRLGDGRERSRKVCFLNRNNEWFCAKNNHSDECALPLILGL
jgi:hypothetical protein